MNSKLYVLGHPVGHSKSPAMHNAAYRALGLDWSYGLADASDEQRARAFIQNRDWLALNVTMPYKGLALELANSRSGAAVLAGGANVLVNGESGIYADNTDGAGCVAFLGRCGVRTADAHVVVCGTGPTSLAIMHACAQAAAGRIDLFGRDSVRARSALAAYLEARAALLGEASETRFGAGSYGEGADRLAAAQVIVDATPLGMSPHDPAPFDVSLLSVGTVVLDVTYGHGESRLVSAARDAGCMAYDGAGMLVAQAVGTVEALARVTGLFEVPADLDLYAVMAEAAGFEGLI